MTQQASTPVRSLHKLGLGICLGGTLFGLVALNPTVSRISDRRERGRVLNESWMRFQTVGILAMTTTVAMWRLGSLKEAESDLDATLAGLKNVLPGGALVTSVASAIVGMRIARQAPEGDTPVESGTEPAPETPGEAARSQRLSAFLGTAKVALVAGVLGLSSALEVRAVERSKGVLSQVLD
ncbi:MAG: hypothetical protein M3122_07020 [Actinomycetota bacterium]|nr:hypothetical protein [Actinomycetota bacterium]